MGSGQESRCSVGACEIVCRAGWELGGGCLIPGAGVPVSPLPNAPCLVVFDNKDGPLECELWGSGVEC